MNQNKVVMIVTAQINPNEKEALATYLQASAPLFKAAGGQPLSKYKIADQLVGEDAINLVSMMEFPSQQALEQVFASADYQDILPIREKAFLKLDVYVSPL